MDFYWVVFVAAGVLAAGLEYANRAGKAGQANFTREFSLFRNNYLVVYSLMMGEPIGGGPGAWHAAPPPPSARSPLPRRTTPPRLAVCPLPSLCCSRRLAAGPPRLPPVRLLRL